MERKFLLQIQSAPEKGLRILNKMHKMNKNMTLVVKVFKTSKHLS